MLKMKISRLHLQTVKVAWGDENWELHQPTNTCMHTHTHQPSNITGGNGFWITMFLLLAKLTTNPNPEISYPLCRCKTAPEAFQDGIRS